MAPILALVLALVLALLVSCTSAGGEESALSAASVSGQDPPTEDRPGYELVFADNFDRDTLGESWSTYSGSPGGDPYSTWDPEHVRIRDGLLVLEGYQRDGAWTTGGVSNWPVTQTYGRWEVRFKATASDELTYHFLLWPKSDSWPPEIDFAEDFGGDRSGLAAFLHYREGGSNQKIQEDLAGVDFTTWQTIGVEWSPGVIRYLLNGNIWATIESDHVPDEPMWLALQAQSGGCERKADYGFPACPIAGVPDYAEVAIDWVAIYAPSDRLS